MRNSVLAIVAIVCLAMLPALWVFARLAVPTLSEVAAETSGGRLGPWWFTWALIWVAALSALVVAWLALASRETGGTA
jgi:hypothetical protein